MKDVIEEYGGIIVCVMMGLVILGIFMAVLDGDGSLADGVRKLFMSALL